MMRIKTTPQALEALRRADAAKLYDTLEPWQQRELLCIVRRLINERPEAHASRRDPA